MANLMFFINYRSYFMCCWVLITLLLNYLQMWNTCRSIWGVDKHKPCWWPKS